MLNIKKKLSAVFAAVLMTATLATSASAATVMALSTVTASANSIDTHEEVYEVDVLENISPVSTNATVTYSRYNKITPYTQITSYSCATTCAGMCVRKSPAELRDAGFDIDWADWYGIGNKYGYTVDWLGRADLSGKDALEVVYNYLKNGYPVCVWINSNTSLSHWVVVYKYSGNGTNFKASDFMCIDPARSWTSSTRDRRLDLAVNYAGVYNTVVFK